MTEALKPAISILYNSLSYGQARQESGGHRLEAQQEGSRAHHAAIDGMAALPGP